MARGLPPKSLCGIPHRLALALQSDGWVWRSELIWAKTNGMPESVEDRPTRAHEQILLFAKSPRYFFDLDAIAEPVSGGTSYGSRHQPSTLVGYGAQSQRGGKHSSRLGMNDPSPTRHPRSVWSFVSEPYEGLHYATFPSALAERCIRAATPQAGCCGACRTPYQRQTTHTPGQHTPRPKARAIAATGVSTNGVSSTSTLSISGRGSAAWAAYGGKTTTTGFAPGCTCPPAPAIPSLVLDPFSGSGTTVLTARALGRQGIGVELSWPFLALARERLGLEALDRWHGKSGARPAVVYTDLPLFAEEAPR